MTRQPPVPASQRLWFLYTIRKQPKLFCLYFIINHVALAKQGDLVASIHLKLGGGSIRDYTIDIHRKLITIHGK